ncbi:MAG TPA: DUF4266 domain-containing protein [Candidatus Polarisedimenticolia bacterium]|nr:DUF4266 domain-containing protein [Candidatus Polarisedimenticolia bacterium]
MTRRPRLWLLAAAVAALLGPAVGCATATIRPWDRDLLAQKKMQYFPYPMVHAVDEHIYFSKEGSTGGEDAAGGGCGCN